MEEQRKTVGAVKGGAHHHKANRGSKDPNSPPTLKEAGIDKNLAQAAGSAWAISLQCTVSQTMPATDAC